MLNTIDEIIAYLFKWVCAYSVCHVYVPMALINVLFRQGIRRTNIMLIKVILHATSDEHETNMHASG